MNEIATLETVTTDELLDRVQRIRDIQAKVMKDGVDYGTIQGCGDKPTLLKPGAETLLLAFQLAAVPEQENCEDLGGSDEVRYRVVMPIKHIPTGAVVGAGVGECSSSEEKYKWRRAVCDAEFEATDPGRRRLKFLRDGATIPQIRTNPADVANTILKMAKKRSLVDGALTATAASRIFTQDVEDLPEEIRGHGDSTAPAKKIDFKPDTNYEGTLTAFTPCFSAPKGSDQKSKPQQLVVDVAGCDLVIGGFGFPYDLHDADIAAAVGKAVQVKYVLQGGKWKNLSHFALVPEKAQVQDEQPAPSSALAELDAALRKAKTQAEAKTAWTVWTEKYAKEPEDVLSEGGAHYNVRYKELK